MLATFIAITTSVITHQAARAAGSQRTKLREARASEGRLSDSTRIEASFWLSSSNLISYR
jgi:hypothetical protein